MRVMAARFSKRRAIELEVSYFDTTDTTDTTLDGVVVPLNAMVQGANFNERVGNKIVMKDLEWRVTFSNEAAVTYGKSSHVRWMVIYDKQTNGALPAVTAVLDTASVTSLTKLANRDRFLILADQLVDFNPGGLESLTVAGIVARTHVGTIDLHGLRTTYSDAAAGIGSVATGGLYVLCIGAIAAGNVDIDMDMRVRLAYYS